MKKKTVITTEKREIWIVREGVPEAAEPIDIGNPVEVRSVEIPAKTGAESEKNDDDDPPAV